MSEEEHMNERDPFDTNTEAYMVLNAMLRIADDLEKVLLALWSSAGLLALIAGVVIYRTLIGR